MPVKRVEAKDESARQRKVRNTKDREDKLHSCIILLRQALPDIPVHMAGRLS